MLDYESYPNILSASVYPYIKGWLQATAAEIEQDGFGDYFMQQVAWSKVGQFMLHDAETVATNLSIVDSDVDLNANTCDFMYGVACGCYSLIPEGTPVGDHVLQYLEGTRQAGTQVTAEVTSDPPTATLGQEIQELAEKANLHAGLSQVLRDLEVAIWGSANQDDPRKYFHCGIGWVVYQLFMSADPLLHYELPSQNQTYRRYAG